MKWEWEFNYRICNLHTVLQSIKLYDCKDNGAKGVSESLKNNQHM